MATEKIISTRILNKVDTLENWNKSTLPLRKGEIAIATVAATAGTGLTEPVCMIKIGEDGVKTFKELPWNVYAKASDVIAAAKSESALTTFVNNVIAGAGIATDEALKTLTTRVGTAENDIDVLEGLVGEKAVATQISDAIAALKLTDTYEVKGEAAKVQNALDSYKTSNDAAIAGIKTGDVINDFKSVETELGKKQAAGDYATKTEAQGYADAKDDAIAAAKKAGTDAQADVDALKAKVGIVPDNKTIVQMITDAQTAATYDDAAVKADIKKNKEDIAAVSVLVGDTAVASQISTAVADAKTELKGSTSDTDASATIAGAKKYADKLDTAMDARVDALESAVGEGGSVAAQITAEIAKLDKADEAVAGKYVSAVSEEDGVITVVRADLPDYTNTYAAKEHNHAIADVIGLQTALGDKANATDVNALSGKVSTLIGEDTGKSIRTIANEELAAQLIPEGAKDSLDTLQEIAAWIQKHPDDASAMSAAISALEEKVGDKTVSAQITEAINALKAGDIKDAVDRITALETDTHTHANKALLDTYTQTEVNLADAVAKKHSHANAAELDKFADGDKAKLDTAVQSITAGTGLKATKTGTDVAVDIDDTVVFIFDCGDSTTV
nr:MAG TPA: hyaluronidase [Caudoviricetes sp.]